SPTTSTLTQSCPSSGTVLQPMTVSGTLSPAQTGATISVTYTRPNSTSFVDQVKTDASGNWTDTVTPSRSDVGNWTIKSHYAEEHDTRAAAECPATFERIT